MIELDHVCKAFNGNAVLKDISVTIKTGETFVIIGMSGTGKTVSLRTIAGFLNPDSGDVFIDGRKMNGASVREKKQIRRSMGMVFQSGALLNWMTVAENVALPLRENTDMTDEEIRAAAEDKLRILGLHQAMNKMPSDISGGMKKRACMARVLVRNPSIILYDEPTSGLDPVMSSHISMLIKKLQKEFGVTSIVVTHDMKSAEYMADRIAVLYKGEIIQCGSPEEILNSDNPAVRQFVNGSVDGPIKTEEVL